MQFAGGAAEEIHEDFSYIGRLLLEGHQASFPCTEGGPDVT